MADKKKEYTREDFVAWGRKSGLENKKKGKEYFSKIGKLGAKKRWSK